MKLQVKHNYFTMIFHPIVEITNIMTAKKKIKKK